MKKFIFIVFIFVEIVYATSVSSSQNYIAKIDSNLASKLNSNENVSVIVWIDKTKFNSDDNYTLSGIGEIKNEFNIIPAIAMEISASELQSLAQQDYVEKITIDRKVGLLRTEGIPLIRADAARNTFAVNGTGINIAIIDTGVYNHSEFQNPNRIVAEKCFISHGTTKCPPNNADESSNATDDNGHGTHVAGIAAGTLGVANNVSIIAVKVMNSSGIGSDSDLVAGIDWAVQNGAKIISLSLGADYNTFTSCYDLASSIAVDNATQLGVTVVIAAGNEGPDSRTIAAPGCAKTVVTIGSISDNDAINSFSSRGSTNDNRTKPDVVAPGESITSTYNNSGYTTASGTSMATPFVSGVAALIIQKYNQDVGYFPEPDRVKAILMTAVNQTRMLSDGYNDSYVNPVRNNVYGSGRIDAYEALRIINFTKNDTIAANETKTYLVNIVNNSLKVTLYWPENSTTYNNLDLIVGNISTNFSNPTHANDTIEQVFLNNIDNGFWKIFVKGVNVSGSQMYFLASSSQFVNDTQSPQWFNQNSNTKVLNSSNSIVLSTYWTDNLELSHAILSMNDTGIWQNISVINFFANVSNGWSNFTWQNISVLNGTFVEWKIYANDTSSNWNFTSTLNFTIIDTTPPYIIGITYTDGYNNIFSPNGDGLYDEITFTSTAYEIANWSTVRVYNSSGDQVKYFTAVNNANSISKTWSGGYTNTVPPYVPDGTYTVNTTLRDASGNSNTTTIATIIIDTAEPNISYAIISPTTIKPNRNISIIVNTSDSSNISYVNRTIYNSSGIVFNSRNLTQFGNLWIARDNVTLADGIYSINVTSVDNIGNSKTVHAGNFTVNTSSNAEGSYVNASVLVPVNQSITINTSITSIITVVINFAVNTTTTGSINITEYTTNNSAENYYTLGKLVEMNVSSAIESNLTWYWLNVSYSDSELTNARIDETSLKIWFYNSTTSAWQQESNSGADTGRNYAWANITHFSLFNINGLLANGQTCTANGNCSSNNCASDYDGAGKWCVPANYCTHDGTSYSSGSATCYGNNKVTCGFGSWSSESCSNGCSNGACVSGPDNNNRDSGGGDGTTTTTTTPATTTQAPTTTTTQTTETTTATAPVLNKTVIPTGFVGLGTGTNIIILVFIVLFAIVGAYFWKREKQTKPKKKK